ncbi:hypothetical protein [Thalassospira mesophila]|uniref:hypothetical protein n=1 Tax=Thalassospira mesophila TaxID=1293891 RepID=UPI001180B4D9|nr:hypothetical protein [Thalassospira mesophila]
MPRAERSLLAKTVKKYPMRVQKLLDLHAYDVKIRASNQLCFHLIEDRCSQIRPFTLIAHKMPWPFRLLRHLVVRLCLMRFSYRVFQVVPLAGRYDLPAPERSTRGPRNLKQVCAASQLRGTSRAALQARIEFPKITRLFKGVQARPRQETKPW